MKRYKTKLSRRGFLRGVGGISALSALSFSPLGALAQQINGDASGRSPREISTSKIPSSGERIPKIGMGTWITFNVGEDRELRDQRTQVLKAFIERGGGMIDCSPMYGSSADVLGYGIERLKNTDRIFSADKIWTRETAEGPDQIQEQQKRWGFETFDLMQVHNLINWRAHLETLRAAKERGQIRYIGITTSHGLRHAQFKQIMETEDLDFVQFSYNILNRDAERDLLPLARERGIAVIANRPFQRKELIRRFQDQPLPDFAAEIGVRNWPQFLLKFIISHPAVTCAIPATTRVDHMIENMGALKGALPDNDMRNRMTRYVEDL